MPCQGILVANVEVAVDLQAYFQDEEHRQAFAAYLRAENVPTMRWWAKALPDGSKTYALGIGSNWVGLAFVGTTIEMSNEDNNLWREHSKKVESAYALAQRYAGQLAQAQTYQQVAASAEAVWDERLHDNGTLEFRFRREGTQVRVVIAADGRSQFITENGDFEGGIDLLRGVFDALRQNSIQVAVGNYESHRHGLAGEHVHTHHDHLAYDHQHS